MGEFKKFLFEGKNLLEEINGILLDMDEDEIDEYGCVLYSEFFGEDDEELPMIRTIYTLNPVEERKMVAEATPSPQKMNAVR